VIQIASMVTNQGESSPVVRNVMTLDTCAAIIGSEVMSFKTEQELLTVIILLPPLHVCFCCDLLKLLFSYKKLQKCPFPLEPTKARQYELRSAAAHHFIVSLEMVCIT